MQHRIKARAPVDACAPHIEQHPDLIRSFLRDAAHVPGGYASGVAFPRHEGEVATLVRGARSVLPVGAQSSLTGGATPRGEVVLSTRALTRVSLDGRSVAAGAGVPLTDLQRILTAASCAYPPVPTFTGAFVGGTIATNAAGAATFKHGSTRHWVDALTIVLPCGDVLDLRRGEVVASDNGQFHIEHPDGRLTVVPVPSYGMPEVAKLSAGYYARPGMDLIDLFIGAEGTLGIVVEAALRVVPRSDRCVALVYCAADAQALAVAAALRTEARDAWRGRGPLDVSAIEYMDACALAIPPDEAFTRAGVVRPGRHAVLLLVQVDTSEDAGAAMERLQDVLDACGVSRDPVIALPGDDRGAQRLFDLREAVPASVNARIGVTQARVHADIQKTAGDMIVPFDRLADSLALYRDAFESRGLEYAIWGHVSDGNLHPNVIPHTLEDMHRGREAILEIARGVMAMGGAPLAEHGVGRSELKQRLLCEMYGADGIAQMRAVKRALDPEWKLAPGVLFPPDA